MSVTSEIKQPTLIFFGYSWTLGHQLDAYQSNLVDAFVKRGFSVHVILSNYLADNVNYGIRADVSQEKIISYIRDCGADLVLSMNHGAMTKNIQSSINCPIISWIVDDIPHIFFPDGSDNLEAMFDGKVKVIISSTELHDQFLRRIPSLKGRLFLLPAATNIEAFKGFENVKRHNISFVGSSLDLRDIYYFVNANLDENKQTVGLILEAIKKMRENYRLDFSALMLELGLDQNPKIKEWGEEKFRMILANLISNNERFQAIEALHELGVSLFGNKDWLNSLATSTRVLECYQAGNVIRNHSQLVDIYQTSKISINIPQIQVESALPYRVFDIMASDSLLITKYHPDSDAYVFFGKDFPAPMYKDVPHLKELCHFYLNNEDARKEIVKKCNLLISKGFSFDERVEDILRLASFSAPKDAQKTGSRVQLATDHFYSLLIINMDSREKLKLLLVHILRILTSKGLRKKLVSLFSMVDK